VNYLGYKSCIVDHGQYNPFIYKKQALIFKLLKSYINSQFFKISQYFLENRPGFLSHGQRIFSFPIKQNTQTSRPTMAGNGAAGTGPNDFLKGRTFQNGPLHQVTGGIVKTGIGYKNTPGV
jgi:hypothetical protein